MVTWRTVSAPNQGAANNLASRGIETILGSLKGVGETLKQPKRDEEAAKKEAFRQALQLTQLDQGQQRINASVDQNEANNEFREEGRDIQLDQFNRQLEAAQGQAVAKSQAADVLFNRQIARDDRQAANALALQESKDAAALERTQAKSGGSKSSGGSSLRKFTDQFIKDNESSIDDETKRALTGLESHLRGVDLPQEVKESIIFNSFRTGTVNDREFLAESLNGDNSPAAFDKFINEYLVTQPQSTGILAPGQGNTASRKAALDIIRPQAK
jgi:hypothetical protein